MNILDLNIRPRISHLLMEHLFMSVLAIPAVYGLPILSENPDKLSDVLALSIWGKILVWAILASIFNVFLIIKNLKRVHLNTLYFDEGNRVFRFETIGLYPQKSIVKEVPINELSLSEEERSYWGVDTQKVLLFRGKKRELVARINFGLENWSSKRKEIGKGMGILNELLTSEQNGYQ